METQTAVIRIHEQHFGHFYTEIYSHQKVGRDTIHPDHINGDIGGLFRHSLFRGACGGVHCGRGPLNPTTNR